jgi:hypothetical protein
MLPTVIQRKKRLLPMLLSLIVLSSCGYHTDTQEETLSVPYFEGDTDGKLTDSVIRAVTASGNFEYLGRGGHLLLEGKVVSDTDHHIGYQFERRPISGKRVHLLVPNEGRREIIVEMTLIDTRTQKIVYGPQRISAYGDFDFIDSDSLRDASFINTDGVRESSLFFSMGQLDSVDGAKGAALDSVYRQLALKIVEGISNLPYNAE